MDKVLVTNDDGYKSIGFYPLLEELSESFDVIAVAPESEKSWIGKSISARTKLKIEEKNINGFKINTINGTPADCVQIGLYEILKKKPKMVISGINLGENAGHARILSSGTVGAAMEASIDGIKSICTSMYIPETIKRKTDFFNPKNYSLFKDSAKISAKLAGILSEIDLGKDIDIVSLNIPYGATIDSEFEVTIPFKEPYGRLFQRHGKEMIHRHPVLSFKEAKKGTDIHALWEGKISITPINLDLSNRHSIKFLSNIIKKEW